MPGFYLPCAAEQRDVARGRATSITLVHLIEYLFHFRKLLFHVGEFLAELCDFIFEVAETFVVCGGVLRRGRSVRHRGVSGVISGEQVGVAGFLGAGLARKHSGERWFALDEALQGELDLVEVGEVMHAFGASAKFARSLGAAEEQHAQDGCLAAIEVEDFLQTMLVLSDAAVGAAGRSGESMLGERGERVADRLLVQLHHGFSIRLLIASIDERIQRERIVVGGGDVLFDESTEDAGFDVGEDDVWHAISVAN